MTICNIFNVCGLSGLVWCLSNTYLGSMRFQRNWSFLIGITYWLTLSVVALIFTKIDFFPRRGTPSSNLPRYVKEVSFLLLKLISQKSK